MAVKKQVTIRQVAQEAGVSIQTVSRVLNSRPDVSPETRQKIQAIINRLGYQPNAIARGLASRRSRTLGLITADFGDYFLNQVVNGAECVARAHNYFFMLGSTECRAGNQPEYIRLLTERHVEGVLFARASKGSYESHLRTLLQSGVPVVSASFHVPDEKLIVVDVDNVDGGRQATQCLIDHGHRRIAMITGPKNWKAQQDRSKGFYLSLQAAGLPVEPGLVAEGDWYFESGYHAMQAILKRRLPFTGLFAQSDEMAIGALRALREAGLRVPQEVSLVGYDDLPISRFIDPPLTTISQPMREVGEIAAGLLIQEIEQPGSVQQKEGLLKTELILRNSCAINNGTSVKNLSAQG
jgi:LacI family transcriptional regulator